MAVRNKKFTKNKLVGPKKYPVGWLIVVAIVLILAIFAGFKMINKSTDSTLTPAGTTTTSNQINAANGAPANSDKTASAAGSSDGTTTSQQLKAPYGTFISNHAPGKNGAPLTVDSVVITTPGASCYIKFTNGGTTKQLASKQVGSNGYAYWTSWKPSDIGLTSGMWKITAVASDKTSSLSTNDTIELEVQ